MDTEYQLMLQKTNRIYWLPSIIHLVVAGIITPFVAMTLVVIRLGVVLSHSIIGEIWILMAWILGIWIGIINSSRYIKKRFPEADYGKITKLSIIGFVLLYSGLDIYKAITRENVFNVHFLFSLLKLGFGITMFHFLSKKHFSSDVNELSFMVPKKIWLSIIIIMVIVILSIALWLGTHLPEL